MKSNNSFGEAIGVALGGLMNDANFNMKGTILIRTPNVDKYGNRLDTRHETIVINGFFTEGFKGRKSLDVRGVEPEVASTMFYTNDVTTPISLKDKFLYNQAYYNIVLITPYRVGDVYFMRRLSLQTSKVEEADPFDKLEGSDIEVNSTGSSAPARGEVP